MATRWKNKILFVAWIFLFTFGLSGILSAMSHGSDYLERDYFRTQKFEEEFNQFINYLNILELNYMPQEEVKKGITVTLEEINEHRYRYGGLEKQITDIKAQYYQKINEALLTNNKELADVYITEKVKKIKDITNNFKSDEHIRVKIIKEKEQKLDEYYRELENYRSEFAKLKSQFQYYLKDISTGKVYTNLDVANAAEVDELINNKNMLVVRSYPTAKQGDPSSKWIYNGLEYEDIVGTLIAKNERSFEGKIGVPKSALATGLVMANYRDYQQKQKIFFIYTFISIMAFLLSLYMSKKTAILQLSATEKWQSYHNRIPIDVIMMGFVTLGFIALIQLTSNNMLYLHEYLYTFIRETFYHLIVSAFFVALTVIHGKSLFERVKDWHSLQVEWPKSLIYRAYQGIKEAFLIRSMGIQILFLLLVVFIFGVGAIPAILIADPEFILLYVSLFIVIGLPIIIVIVKRTGYFNRIVTNTSELVRGNLEPDLPVLGKSTLAILADNINTLKHGVKTSRKEQAKSERLKTELITNVSHDLRTPLTSIITYTELLKTPDLTVEDREAYIQIIDRKSKRLKVLIDDLFEASKMVSGSIELNKEKVDVVQLLQQALAEHNETISESTLQFRATNPDKPVYAIVDGQKLWRVFDNLIGNILKYSLENTRVFISVKALHDKAIIVFKNVAKYELGEDIDDLFERFKRGDTSRNTEGSGLGLAIAKSIVDLHGGSLDIEVDGDLFKITVSLNTMLD